MITIINYGMGNMGSIANMIKRIGIRSEITSDISKIDSAERIILPGVGNFDKAIQNINGLGVKEIITKKALHDRIPILGICLGMQIMCKKSEEGKEPGLGIIDAEVKKFSFLFNQTLKVPHMGWNIVNPQKESAIFLNLDIEPRFYFVHSYYVICHNKIDILATTNYGHDFVSAFAQDNIIGVQFHPEKSHKFGMHLLSNFIMKF